MAGIGLHVEVSVQAPPCIFACMARPHVQEKANRDAEEKKKAGSKPGLFDEGNKPVERYEDFPEIKDGERYVCALSYVGSPMCPTVCHNLQMQYVCSKLAISLEMV